MNRYSLSDDKKILFDKWTDNKYRFYDEKDVKFSLHILCYELNNQYRQEMQLRNEIFKYNKLKYFLNDDDNDTYKECIHCKNFKGYNNHCEKSVVCINLSYATKCPYYKCNYKRGDLYD